MTIVKVYEQLFEQQKEKFPEEIIRKFICLSFIQDSIKNKLQSVSVVVEGVLIHLEIGRLARS